MKFGQLIEYNKINISLQEQCTIFLKKIYMKQVVCSLVSIYFDSPQLIIQ